MPWVDEPLAEVVAAARFHGLQVIYHEPSAADLAAFAGEAAILGWDVDHEPSIAAPDGAQRERLGAFRDRRAVIRARDPGRPVCTVNSPSISPPRTALWLEWARAGDVAAFWKYPYMAPPVDSLSGPRGVPEVTRRAVHATGQAKPVWYVAQAMASPLLDWYMPSDAEARAMIYAGLIHGATGIVWFAFDSYVTRNGRVLGIAPTPEADYGVDLPRKPSLKPVLVATPEGLAGSRRLWATVGRLNRELATLAPALLAPTAAREYRVSVRGQTPSAAPVRTLLKTDGDALLLLAVNIDARPVEVRFAFAKPVRTLSLRFDSRAPPVATGDGWEDRLEPFGVRVYRFRLGPRT